MMGSYRDAAPPRVHVIRLAAFDVHRLGVTWAVATVVFLVSWTVTMMLVSSRLVSPVLGLPAALAFTVVGLLALRRRVAKLRQLHYLLEVSDASVRLLAPDGAFVGDTAAGWLTIALVNYTRRGRYGSAWLRPGFLLRHREGEELIGTLLPELPWDGVEDAARMPDFELHTGDFAVLSEHVRRAPRRP